MNDLLKDKLDANEAAKYVGLSGNTIRAYARDGYLRHIRMGKRYYFAMSDLDKLTRIVESQTTPNVPNNDLQREELG